MLNWALINAYEKLVLAQPIAGGGRGGAVTKY